MQPFRVGVEPVIDIIVEPVVNIIIEPETKRLREVETKEASLFDQPIFACTPIVLAKKKNLQNLNLKKLIQLSQALLQSIKL